MSLFPASGPAGQPASSARPTTWLLPAVADNATPYYGSQPVAAAVDNCPKCGAPINMEPHPIIGHVANGRFKPLDKSTTLATAPQGECQSCGPVSLDPGTIDKLIRAAFAQHGAGFLEDDPLALDTWATDGGPDHCRPTTTPTAVFAPDPEDPAAADFAAAEFGITHDPHLLPKPRPGTVG